MMFNAMGYAETECSVKQSEEQVDEQMEIKTDVPEYLRGATITVTLKDGRKSVVPAERFKVVPRVQQFVVTKTSKLEQKTCLTKVEEAKRHRVSLLGGHGAQPGLTSNTKLAPNLVTVESNVGLVGGAQYQYRTDLKVFGLPINVGGQLQTNQTGSFVLGVDF